MYADCENDPLYHVPLMTLLNHDFVSRATVAATEVLVSGADFAPVEELPPSPTRTGSPGAVPVESKSGERFGPGGDG